MRNFHILKNFVVVAFAATACLSHALAGPGDTVADAVLGQVDFSSGAINAGGTPTASTLNEPRGLCIDRVSGRLFIADSFNHRVLSWPSPAAFTNGQAADLVFGQPDFTSNNANQGGVNPNNKTLNAPKGVAADSAGRLYVADSLNIRILRFDPPFSTNMAASAVFGQAGSFTTSNQANIGAPTADDLGNPDAVALDAADRLYCADRFLSRVTIYSTPLTSSSANLVLGQTNLTTAGANLNQTGLDHCSGVAIDTAGNVYVGDEFNNRIMRYSSPTANGPAATHVLGQPNFTSNTANNGGISASSIKYSGSSAAVAVDPTTRVLYVSDALNNRVLEFTDPANNAAAARVFGQPDFATATANTGGRSAVTLQDPAGVAIDSAGNLYVSDRLNHRVLRYNAAKADLAVVALAVPSATTIGGKVTVTVTVTNAGPDAATNVELTDAFAGGFSLDSATASQGACNGNNPSVCGLGSLASGASATVTLVMSATQEGAATATATAKAAEADPNAGNDSATATVTITAANTTNDNASNDGNANEGGADNTNGSTDDNSNANGDGEVPLPQACGLCGAGTGLAAFALTPLLLAKRRMRAVRKHAN